MAAVRYLSVSDIAERLNVPRHRVVYALMIYAIQPSVRVGHSDNACTGYDDAALEQVRARLGVDRREAVAFSKL